MRNTLAAASLVGVTLIWGWTFTVVKDAVHQYDVLSFLFWRFLIAAVIFAYWSVRAVSFRLWTDGCVAGFLLATAYLFQTIGLKYTAATNCGLITGLFVVLTPLLEALVFRRRLPALQWIAAGASMLGIALLTGSGFDRLRFGDGLTFVAAMAFAAHVVWLGQVAARHQPLCLAGWQFITASLSFAAAALLLDTISLPAPAVVPALAITSILATAVGFFVQTAVQRVVPPTQTAVILAMESGFAAIFGVWLAGDRLTGLQWLGAAIIVTATIGSECWKYSTQLAAVADGSSTLD